MAAQKKVTKKVVAKKNPSTTAPKKALKQMATKVAKSAARKPVAKAAAKAIPTTKPVVKKPGTVKQPLGKTAAKKPLSSRVEKALDAVATIPSASTVTDDEEGRSVAVAKRWFIVQVLIDHMTIFGIASDQRMYRWDTRAGVWVLHKEGA